MEKNIYLFELWKTLYLTENARRKKYVRTTWLEVPRERQRMWGMSLYFCLETFPKWTLKIVKCAAILALNIDVHGQIVWNLLFHYGAHARYAYVFAYE